MVAPDCCLWGAVTKTNRESFFFVCVCVCAHRCLCSKLMWEGQRTTIDDWVFSFYYIGSGDQTQVARFVDKYLYSLSHVDDPGITFRVGFHLPCC